MQIPGRISKRRISKARRVADRTTATARAKLSVGAVAALSAATFGGFAAAGPASAAPASSYLYAATNSAGGNSIVVFDRAADGTLSQAGSYPTGGTGSGPPASAGFEQSENGVILGGRAGAENTTHTNRLSPSMLGATASRSSRPKGMEF